jgi:hypothetical protein
MRIVSITAGAGGMFCGSCLRDNAAAAALIALGHDALLVPTYTPITTDEQDVSTKRVFLGGVNVYLQNAGWLFRHLPRLLDKLLNTNALLRWAGGFVGRTDYSKLGGLTTAMLEGTHGKAKKEIAKLVDWLAADVKPDVVLMTNALLSGACRPFARASACPCSPPFRATTFSWTHCPTPTAGGASPSFKRTTGTRAGTWRRATTTPTT